MAYYGELRGCFKSPDWAGKILTSVYTTQCTHMQPQDSILILNRTDPSHVLLDGSQRKTTVCMFGINFQLKHARPPPWGGSKPQTAFQFTYVHSHLSIQGPS